MRQISSAKSPLSFRSLLDNIAFLQQTQQASGNLNAADPANVSKSGTAIRFSMLDWPLSRPVAAALMPEWTALDMSVRLSKHRSLSH